MGNGIHQKAEGQNTCERTLGPGLKKSKYEAIILYLATALLSVPRRGKDSPSDSQKSLSIPLLTIYSLTG